MRYRARPMTLISDLIAAGPTRSLEFFPPRDEQGESLLAETLADLEPLGPSFASVTYGAGGSTRDRTRDLVVDMNRRERFPTMAHLTCVGHTRAEITGLLDAYAAAGVQNILALGGDPPVDGSDPAGDFRYALELIAFIANHPAEFCVGVAAHPEGHPRSPDLTEDRRRLAEKLEDADFAITQFFFGVEPYLRLVDDLAKLGCDRPLVPGVMPFVSAPGLMRMASMNGTHIPSEIGARLETASPEDVARIGVEVASELSRDLIEAGAPGVHLYTLNRSASVRSVWAALGPQSQAPTT